MRRAARAEIDLRALRHNLKRSRRAAPASRVMAVIKADGYGHGMLSVAQALHDADAFAVADVNEALVLREAGIEHPVLALQGFRDARELAAAAQADIQVTMHERSQLRLLETISLRRSVAVWLKVETGMQRLGFAQREVPDVYQRLRALSVVKPGLKLMTHLACADDRTNPSAHQQITRFDQTVARLEGEQSIANSAGVLGLPASHRDWVRPGIMLYGASPFVDGNAEQAGLRPAMTVKAPLIAIRTSRRGDAIGYGGRFVCPQDMRVGVAGIGYGDGYPRHAPDGTPVLLNGQRTRLIGRVSMDMITIDLCNIIEPAVGDEVVLWGEGLSVDEVARSAGTVSYELLCHAGHAMQRHIIDEDQPSRIISRYARK